MDLHTGKSSILFLPGIFTYNQKYAEVLEFVKYHAFFYKNEYICVYFKQQLLDLETDTFVCYAVSMTQIQHNRDLSNRRAKQPLKE